MSIEWEEPRAKRGLTPGSPVSGGSVVLAGLMALLGGKGLDSCLLMLGENFLGSLFHSETTVETLMLPADPSYSLSEHASYCGFQHEKEIGGEGGPWGSFLFLLFFFFFLFFLFPKNAFWPSSFPKFG